MCITSIIVTSKLRLPWIYLGYSSIRHQCLQSFMGEDRFSWLLPINTHNWNVLQRFLHVNIWLDFYQIVTMHWTIVVLLFLSICCWIFSIIDVSGMFSCLWQSCVQVGYFNLLMIKAYRLLHSHWSQVVSNFIIIYRVLAIRITFTCMLIWCSQRCILEDLKGVTNKLLHVIIGYYL